MPAEIEKDLRFHMARARQVFLDVDRGVAEIGVRFAPGTIKRGGKLARIVDHAHALATTAEGCLDRDRVTEFFAQRGDRLDRLGRFGSPWHHRDLGLSRMTPGSNLVSHRLDGCGRGTDPGDAGPGYRLGEPGVLGEKAIAGMNRIGPSGRRDLEDLLGVEVGLGSRCRAHVPGFISQLHMQRVTIEVGIDGNRVDAHLLGSADDPHRDLSPVGNKEAGNGH